MHKKINFYFRKKAPYAFSIEILFFELSKSLQKEHNVITNELYAPCFSTSPWKILKNIFWAYKNQSYINHISGDIHYIILAFSSRNINILTIHDCALLDILSKKQLKFHFYKILWFDLPMKKADIITTISEKTKNDLITHFNINPNKIILIPNFVNNNFKFTPKPFNKSLPNILQVGTNENKNIERLLEAIQQIPCKLTILGPLNDKLYSLLYKYNINFINYSGIDNNTVIKLYTLADIICFISTFEGFGMPIIEAQAIGRVVITSNIPPMNDVAGKGAHLVDPYSVDEIKNGIVYVSHNDEYRLNLIKLGLENVKKYTLENISGKYINLYERVSSRKQR